MSRPAGSRFGAGAVRWAHDELKRRTEALSRLWARASRRAHPDEQLLPGRARARLVSALVVSVLFVGLLFVAVFPTRSYLAQRASVRDAQERLDALDREKHRLQREARRLTTPAEIERLARAQYGLVRPGEEAYAILPAPVPPIGLPEVWPFKGVEQILGTR